MSLIGEDYQLSANFESIASGMAKHEFRLSQKGDGAHLAKLFQENFRTDGDVEELPPFRMIPFPSVERTRGFDKSFSLVESEVTAADFDRCDLYKRMFEAKCMVKHRTGIAPSLPYYYATLLDR